MNIQLAPVQPVPPPARPAVTPDQLDLIKATIAKGATDEELRLFLYDCTRQGVHPLDKLIHFTKRSGKYTPITSIDFMRSRAAETGECAGIDDAVFTGTSRMPDFAATVTVWRLVQGQRYAFTATARWSEYKPDPPNDFMWRKMPFVMLGKVTEALALRKGFPRELAGLYATEELDQARDTPARPAVEQVDTVTGEVTYPTNAETGTISEAQSRRLFALAKKAGWQTEALRTWFKQSWGLERTSDMLRTQYDEVCAAIEAGPQGPPL